MTAPKNSDRTSAARPPALTPRSRRTARKRSRSHPTPPIPPPSSTTRSETPPPCARLTTTVDDFSLHQQRAELDELVHDARTVERAIVDHLAHTGITDPIAVATALLAHRADPYPLERDLLDFEPAAR